MPSHACVCWTVDVIFGEIHFFFVTFESNHCHNVADTSRAVYTARIHSHGFLQPFSTRSGNCSPLVTWDLLSSHALSPNNNPFIDFAKPQKFFCQREKLNGKNKYWLEFRNVSVETIRRYLENWQTLHSPENLSHKNEHFKLCRTKIN